MTTLRPGTSATISAAGASTGTLRRSGVLFMPHFYEYGVEETPIEATSMTDFESKLGTRQSHSVAYDCAEAYFARGGKKIVASRVVGPTTVAATAILFDQSGSGGTDDALLLTAKGKHKYDNKLNYAVTVDGTDFEIVISHDDLGTLVESGTLADRAAAVAWSADNDYVTVSLGDSAEDPRAQTGSFSGGDDDYANATITEWQAAEDALTKDLGPGQIAWFNKTTTAFHTAMLQAALDKNRFALCDCADGETYANLIAEVAAQRSNDEELASCGQLFDKWAELPGLSSSPSTPRAIPYSAVQAGIYAANDGAGMSCNQPGAGVLNGKAKVVDALRDVSDLAWTPEQVDALNTAGVTVTKDIEGHGIVTWGNRTMASPDGEASDWLSASNRRLAMDVVDKADMIALTHVFAMLEGQKRTVGGYGGELRAMLSDEVSNGGLFVDPDDPRISTAFLVDVDGPNTLETMQDGELNADIDLRMSPHSELVRVRVTRKQITEALA